MESDFKEQVNFLEFWLKTKALPLWANLGINPQNGAVYERLTPEGMPDSKALLRSRVQSRQILVFANCELMGWFENSSKIVGSIHQFLENNAKQASEDIGYAHLINHQGGIVDGKRDTYDFAFFLLSSAYQLKAYSNVKELENAKKLLGFIETHFRESHGGWSEGNYETNIRRQNPHMHLFEAFLTLYEFSNEAHWLAKAGQIYSLFEAYFFDHKHGVLREFFDPDWRISASPKGNIVEPGHMFEWVWLLRWYEKLTHTDVSGYCNTLYENALKIGLHTNSTLVFDEVSPTGEVIKGSKRLWPITELIKASIVQAESNLYDARRYESIASLGIRSLFDHYFCRSQDLGVSDNATDQQDFDGRYIDQLDHENAIVNSYSPASTLYHIVMAATVASNYKRKNNNEKQCQ